MSRKHGTTAEQLTSVLQLMNNNGDNTADDVEENDVARGSIRWLVFVEEEPGI
ncbi:unnamed protein product [Ascophyllum nodosum]